jgi:hypothetical protein
MFGNAGPDGRLDASDAILVDAIHTCSGLLGFREPYAHVDFYPNKGIKSQPGCNPSSDIACGSLCVNVRYTCPRTGPHNGAECERRIVNNTHWLGRLVGAILPRIPRLDSRAIYCRSLSKVVLA